MQKSFKILFYRNGDPLDPLCIKRFVNAFSKGYGKVVGKVIKNSERLDKRAFKENVATLMPPFKMTRRGAFRGVKIDKKGIIHDPNHIIDLCWERVGDGLQELKSYITNNVPGKRSRITANLSPETKDYIVGKTSKLYENLLREEERTGQVTPVAASKVLFATLPEFALPVDNLEWDEVFKVEKKHRGRPEGYAEILSTMISEIKEWENKSKRHLEELDPQPTTTLPAVYNILAMSVRPLAHAKW